MASWVAMKRAPAGVEGQDVTDVDAAGELQSLLELQESGLDSGGALSRQIAMLALRIAASHLLELMKADPDGKAGDAFELCECAVDVLRLDSPTTGF